MLLSQDSPEDAQRQARDAQRENTIAGPHTTFFLDSPLFCLSVYCRQAKMPTSNSEQTYDMALALHTLIKFAGGSGDSRVGA
jgi:hypothetical protein